ncbi:MAG: YggS family pyridoxal phosphate-dependent enzyme [Gammaproteobacteria bacterium]
MKAVTLSIQQRLQAVQQQIFQAEKRFGREAGSVHLLAVSKTRPAEDILAVYQTGQTAFGENYLQEALEKIRQLADYDIHWHFIGPIQSNKTKDIARHFAWVHSIDRLKIARRLSEQRPAELPPLRVCIQVNIDKEASKSGVSPGGVLPLAKEIQKLPNLQLKGLMAIPTATTDFTSQRDAFARVRTIYEQLQQTGISVDTLSMGMTNDLEAAIAEGSTMVRIGTAIFGPRQYKKPAD